MSIRIYAIGHFKKKDALLEQVAEYTKRLKKPYLIDFDYLQPKHGADVDEKRWIEEGEWLLRKSDKCIRIALDADGERLTTAGFARLLERSIAQDREVAFLIGGSIGHHPKVLDAVSRKISLSPMTFPHRLAYLVLVEQIYRAQAIKAGSPYAK